MHYAERAWLLGLFQTIYLSSSKKEKEKYAGLKGIVDRNKKALCELAHNRLVLNELSFINKKYYYLWTLIAVPSATHFDCPFAIQNDVASRYPYTYYSEAIDTKVRCKTYYQISNHV